MEAVIGYIRDLGASVLLPILIFILALVFGAKPGKALRAAVTVGIGFIGLGLVIGLLIGALAPATEAFIARTGVNLVAMDVGWGVAAAVAFGTVVGGLIVPVTIGVNVLMLATRLTKTLNIDIWNYWHYAFSGSLVYIVTKSLPLALVAASLHCAYSLWMADVTAKRVQEFFGIPGVSIPQGWAVTSIPVVLLVNKVVDMIPGLRDVKADPDTIQKKLGIVGDPLFLGLVLGALFGLLAGFDFKATATLAMQMAAVMLLVPRIISIFMEGLVPVAEAAREFMSTRFKGREFYIGLDSAILIGHPVTIATGILMIPVTLLLAVVLPGNTTLPFGDLAATAFFVAMAAPLMGGNLVRTTIAGVFIMTMVLYLSTGLSPMLTETAASIGYKMPENATTITALSGGNLVAWILTMISRIFG